MSPTLKAQREQFLKELLEKLRSQFWQEALEELRSEGDRFYMQNGLESFYATFDELPQWRQQQVLGEKLRDILTAHLLSYTVLSHATLYSYVRNALYLSGCKIKANRWTCPLQPKKVSLFI